MTFTNYWHCTPPKHGHPIHSPLNDMSASDSVFNGIKTLYRGNKEYFNVNACFDNFNIYLFA